ncbi:helix-turn-helix domain-containing protein [Paraburkholderia sp. UYCP14C]|uniref:helix-turn-helix domain-containing protein n=1 Tax=Paraburkholderia sp. UYCP14C TaxID=2511130 RepID=UPI0010216120|nr:helix-turn-helix domain-containing protein [Paraburkholderia sp. UYCP14C]RZF24852.1 helix-turn-helix domain-containing protein [Paraburkholderia sp. UYCP14C]
MNPTSYEGRASVHLSAASAITAVEIVLFDGFSLPKVAAIVEIFQSANELTGTRANGELRYAVSLLSSSGGAIISSSAVSVWTEQIGVDRAPNSTILLFIAGGAGAMRAARDERLSDWIRSRYPISAIVCPISEGKLILDAIPLSSRSDLPPRSRRGGGAIDDEQSEIPTAPIQTALQIVKEDLSTQTICYVTRPLPVWTVAHSDDAAARAPSFQRVSDKIMASARWLDENVDRPISIELAADVAAMSERNFLRRFKAEMGVTPSDYLQNARLKLSCRMLIESQLPVDKIARRCGIGSGRQLAKLFKKHLSITPTHYRLNRSREVL